MRHKIEQASDIGGVICAARKAQHMRQDDAAGSLGVSESFMVKAERGADTVQWGKLFQIFEGLGVQITVDIPDASADLLAAQLNRASVWRSRTVERRRTGGQMDAGQSATTTTEKKRGAE